MRTLIVIGMAAAATLGLLPPNVFGFSASYTQKVKAGRLVALSHVLIKDELIRVETTVEGQTFIIIANQQGLFNYSPNDGVVMRLPIADKDQQIVEGLRDYGGYLQAHQAELLKTELLNEVVCDVYRVVDLRHATKTTAWVWREKQFPLRIEIDLKGDATVIELSDIELGIVIDESAFALPAGVPIMDPETSSQPTEPSETGW